MITDETILHKQKKIPHRIIEDELIIVDINKETVIQINETGKTIWELIDGSNTITKIIKELLNNYDVSEKKATADVFEFANKLSNKELVYY